jgi:hypothetical protein
MNLRFDKIFVIPNFFEWRTIMINKSLAKITVSLILAFVAHSANAGEIKTRTYTFKTTSNSFTCQQGIASNGHNFPVDTSVRFSTQYGASSIFFPSKISLNNSPSVALNLDGSVLCSELEDIMNVPGYIDAKAIQEFETTISPTANGECFKRIREDLKIEVGKYKLTGAQVFYQPMDADDCVK